MDKQITCTCQKSSYWLCVARSLPILFIGAFFNYICFTKLGDVGSFRYWIIGFPAACWFVVLCLGLLRRYFYRLNIRISPAGEIFAAESIILTRTKFFDKTVTFRNVVSTETPSFIRSSNQWAFGSYLTDKQRQQIITELNPRSSESIDLSDV